MGDLVVPSIPTLWIRTPPPLIQHGAKRVPRTQSSLNKRQLGYEMYLNGHLPRSEKLLKGQLLIFSCGTQGQVSVSGPLLSLLFTWAVYPACWPYCHTCDTGEPSFRRCFVRFGLMLRNPHNSTIQVGLPPLKIISEKSSFSSLLWLPKFTWDCFKFFPSPIAWVRNNSHVNGQCITSTLQET